MRSHSDKFEDNDINRVRLNRLLQKKDEEIVEIFKKFDDVAQNGASQENFDDLKERFEIFSQIETIKKLQEEFMPKIVEFADNIDCLMDDNQDVKVCVRNFDDRLSLKAEKSAMLCFKQDLEDNYLNYTDLEKMNFKFNDMENLIKT